MRLEHAHARLARIASPIRHMPGTKSPNAIVIARIHNDYRERLGKQVVISGTNPEMDLVEIVEAGSPMVCRGSPHPEFNPSPISSSLAFFIEASLAANSNQRAPNLDSPDRPLT